MKYFTSVLMILITAGAFLHTANANAAYVSDRLYLGLYAEADSNSALLKTMVSGTAVEVIGNQGDYAQLRLEDGTVGWAKAEFISDDMPAKIQLQQVTGERDKLRNQMRRVGSEQDTINQLREQLKKANDDIRDLNQQLDKERAETSTSMDIQQQQAEQQTQIDDLQQQLKSAQEAAATAQQQLNQLRATPAAGGDKPQNVLAKIGWMLLSMLISIALGAILGIRWLSVRIRRRFNGLKVW